MVTGTYPGFVNLQNNTNGSQKRLFEKNIL